MADAWGGAFGVAWGAAFGSGSSPSPPSPSPPAPAPAVLGGSSGGGRIAPHYDQGEQGLMRHLHDDDDVVLEMIREFLALVGTR